MLEQIFNSPEVANAGIWISGLATAFSVAAAAKGINDFRKEHKLWSRFGSVTQAVVGGIAAIGSIWVGVEANMADMKFTRSAPAVGSVNDFPLAPEPESAPPGP